jgi:hypothetical protein
MTNHIRQVQLQNRVLNPAEAEIWVRVFPDQVTRTTEVHGRLTGPHCPYATTVEVAYPLRPLPRPIDGLPGLTMRVVIPEPSWWDPVSPFLYSGPIELWQDGERCDVVEVRHGLRSLSLTGPRLRLNGQPLTLHAVECEQCSEQEALRLHQAGFNTLLVPVQDDTREIWDLADRVGFLVLGRLSLNGQPTASPDVSFTDRHPSHLGWLLEADAIGADQLADAVSLMRRRLSNPLVGIELRRIQESIPAGAQFVLCDVESLPSLATIALPKLIRADVNDELRQEMQSLPGVLGTVAAHNRQ